MKKKSLFNSIALIFAFSFLLCSCQKTNKPGVLPDTEKVEYGSLYFDSIEQLHKAIKDYPSCLNAEDIRNYKINRFDEIAVDYYPQMMNEKFVLLTIEVNPYRVFYYYVPSGTSSFHYSTGILVTVPREKGATIESVKKQFGASVEPDGSIFVPEIRSWFVPIEKNYYKISFPDSMPNCEKSIIKMVMSN